MTDAIAAKGTELKRGDGATPESFTTILEMVNIGGPDMSVDTLDPTAHSSGGWREVIAGIKDAGEITLEGNFVPDNAQHVGLRTDYANGTLRNFQLVFPDAGATTWTLPCLVTNYGPNSDVADLLKFSVTLKVSGEPTLA